MTNHSTTSGNAANSTTTGDYAHSSTSGDGSNSTTYGKNSIAVAVGCSSTASAMEGGAIMLAAYDDRNNLVAVFASMVGQNGIEHGVKYRLKLDGTVEEVK